MFRLDRNSFVKGNRHSSICSAESPGERGASESEPSNVESVGNSIHIETGNSVALQTAQAQVAGKGIALIRVLFDTASHTSFVTMHVAEKFSLETLQKESLGIERYQGQNSVSNKDRHSERPAQRI